MYDGPGARSYLSDLRHEGFTCIYCSPSDTLSHFWESYPRLATNHRIQILTQSRWKGNLAEMLYYTTDTWQPPKKIYVSTYDVGYAVLLLFIKG